MPLSPYRLLFFGLFLVYVFLQIVVYRRIASLSTRHRRMLLLAQITLFVAATTGIAMQVQFIARHTPAPYAWRSWIRQLTSLYLGCAVTGIVLYECVWLITRRLPVSASRRRTLAAIAGAAPAIVAGYGLFIERRTLRIREVSAPIAGLHRDLEGLRIVQISDIHLSPTLSLSDLRRVIDAANELQGDLVVVTGDLITGWLDPLELCLRELARLRSRSGVFGTLGNHEIYARVEERLTSLGPQYGIPFLRYEAKRLKLGTADLNLVGVDYESNYQPHGYLRGCEKVVAPGACNVLLSHNPNVFPTAASQGFDLVLAGHTHGGQINIEILKPWVRRYVTPYIDGLYQFQRDDARRTIGFVTRGIGTITVPVRIAAPPEIAMLRLVRA